MRAALAAVSDPTGQALSGRLRQLLRGLTEPLARCALTPEGAGPARWQVTIDLIVPVRGDGRVLQTTLTDPDHTLERACVDRALAPLDLRGAGAPPRVRVALALSRQREPRYAPAEEPPTCPPAQPGTGGGGVGDGTIGLGASAAAPPVALAPPVAAVVLPEPAPTPPVAAQERAALLALLQRQIEGLERAGRLREAATAYMQLADRDPNHPKYDELLYNAAVLFQRSKLLGLALQARERLLRERPASPLAKRALYRDAQAYQFMGLYEQAAEP